MPQHSCAAYFPSPLLTCPGPPLCSCVHLLCPLPQALWNQLLITLLSNVISSHPFVTWALKATAHPSFQSKTQISRSWNHHDLKLRLINWNQGKEEKTLVSVSCLCWNYFLCQKHVTFFLCDSQQSRSQGYTGGWWWSSTTWQPHHYPSAPGRSTAGARLPFSPGGKLTSSAWITVHSQCLVQRRNIRHVAMITMPVRHSWH